MAYYALFYDAVNDFIARRGAYRDEHLRLARDAHALPADLPWGATKEKTNA